MSKAMCGNNGYRIQEAILDIPGVGKPENRPALGYIHRTGQCAPSSLWGRAEAEYVRTLWGQWAGP